MFKTSRSYLLLLLVFVFSFVFRVVLMLREGFPPGADIGLHNSIVYSITQGGNTDFLWNSFHMGGGASLTFPGYHIFVSYVVLLTGLSDYVAHSLVVSLFSSLIVLVVFLITRKAWNESSALIIAFLVAISRFDMEMLLWGGYPNAVALMLIPLAFYLFLAKDKFSLVPFLAVTSFISGAIFLTHSLSAVMYGVFVLAMVFFGVIFAKKMGVQRIGFLSWLLPLVLGAILVSPFLFEVVPAYLGANGDTFTGGVAGIMEAVLSTKILPLDLVLPLFGCFFLFFLFSKQYKGKFLTVPALLFVVWTLIPALLTQGYLVGFYTDYNRFLYFVIIPVITLIGLGIDHGSTFFANVLTWLVSTAKELPKVRMSTNKTLHRVLPHLKRKNFLATFVLVFVLYAFLSVPIFLTPAKGVEVQSFYQVMNKPGYDAVQWAQKNTPANSVFVTDALYGWWFSGFAQRPTISAVDPQYLTLSREFEPAKVASNLLDTNFLVDNGLIQVREDGGYIGRHNPIFLAKLSDSYFPYPFFHFNNDEITVLCRQNGKNQYFDLIELPVTDMHLEANANYASIFVTRGNQLFNFTEVTTVYAGVRFANMSITLDSTAEGVSLDWVRFILHTKGFPVMQQNTVALVDKNMKVAGQLVFNTGQLEMPNVYTSENPSCLELFYGLEGKTQAQIDFSVGVYEFEPPEPKATAAEQEAFYNALVAENAVSFMKKVADLPLEVFNYRQGVVDQNVSYVAVRDFETIPRFAKDPLFSLVFINNEVAIFQVHKNLR